MSGILAQIASCYKENVDIISRIEAVEKVRSFSYAVEWQRDIDEATGLFYWPEVVEHKCEEDLVKFLQKWKFPCKLQGDLQSFIDRLNWNPSSWQETKQLNKDIERVALSLGNFCQNEKGEMFHQKHEDELSKFLKNLECIQEVLQALEEKVVRTQSRLEQVKHDLDQKAKNLKECMFRHEVRASHPLFSSCLDSAEQAQQLSSMYPGHWRLIYQGTKDGMTPQAFHKHADGKGPTLTVIKSGENIFGGYTKVPWSSPATGQWGGSDETASLFTLKSSLGMKPQRFPVKNASNAVYHYAPYGPVFGNGHDICCRLGGSCYSNFIGSCGYQNTTGHGPYALIGGGGSQNFTLTDVIVFALAEEGSSSSSSSVAA